MNLTFAKFSFKFCVPYTLNCVTAKTMAENQPLLSGQEEDSAPPSYAEVDPNKPTGRYNSVPK